MKDRLKQLRKEYDITQKDLANKIGVSPSTIAMYETGQRNPDSTILSLLADFFNVSIDYLLGRSSNPQLSEKEEINIQLELDNMRKQLEEGTLQMNLDGEEIDDEIKQFIIENMENTLTLAKIKAKEKFTPKKYRK